MIDDCLKNHKGIITFEESNTAGGLGSAVLEAFAMLGDFPERFKMLGIEDTYEKIVGSQKYLRASNGLLEAVPGLILRQTIRKPMSGKAVIRSSHLLILKPA